MAELVEFARRRLEMVTFGLVVVAAAAAAVVEAVTSYTVAAAGDSSGTVVAIGIGASGAGTSVIGIFTGDFYCDTNRIENRSSNFFYV